MKFQSRKKPCKLHISGLRLVYQTERPEEALARLARAAFSTVLRNSSESIAAAQEWASRAWSIVASGSGSGRASDASRWASGRGPGANRRRLGPEAPRA